MSEEKEEQIRQQIREVYNSGDCGKALELAIEFLEEFPDSRLARYCFAVMHGDHADAPHHSIEEKQRFIEIAKKGLQDLKNDPQFSSWPSRFQQSVRNEIYWFFEQPENQYNLGQEVLSRGENGHYSSCVGASMMALKKLQENDLRSSEDWANKSIHHFREFEKLSPDWYNINFFSAQALACLGKYDEAVSAFKDMFRKQKSAVKQDEVDNFLKKLEEIKSLRNE